MTSEQRGCERIASIESGLEQLRRGDAKVAIALQGSFGHMMYAQGIMAALQRAPVPAIAASSCVEMMFPALLYARGGPIAFDGRKDLESFWLNLWRFTLNTDPLFDPTTYWKNVMDSHLEVFRNFSESFFDIFELSGVKETARFFPPGSMKFNPLFIKSTSENLDELMEGAQIPVFTNALNVENFNEVVLYTGPLKDEAKERVKGCKGQRGVAMQREVLELNAERFFASGARPPILAPIEVSLRPEETESGEWEVEHWMEGAMRCNPPLNPLIDAGADVILLIRFFARNKSIKLMRNHAALLDRYLETMFTAPLEKEIESIEAMNGLVLRAKEPPDDKRVVSVLDPSTSDYGGVPNPARVESLAELVSRKLDAFSHFKASNIGLRQKMFDQGLEIGDAIIGSLFR